MTSVVISDIWVYGSANMPEADAVAVGGAVDFTRKVMFCDITPNGLMDVVSSSASDTGVNCKIVYAVRDATGAVVQETLTLSGQTVVAGTKTTERLLYAAVSTASANGPLASPGTQAPVGDVGLISHTAVSGNGTIASPHTAQAGSANRTTSAGATFNLASGDGARCLPGHIIRTQGGTGPNQLRMVLSVTGDVATVNRDWGTLPDGTTTYATFQGFLFDILPQPITSVIRAFSTAAADVAGGSSRSFYEKVFVSNQNATPTSLTSATVASQAQSPALPGSATLNIATCTALNDTNTTTNRQTTPASGASSFTSGTTAQAVAANSGTVPGGGTAANAEGVWLQLVLPAGSAAYKGTETLRVQGTTT